MKTVPHGGDDQNIANITSVKYYLLRAFTEKNEAILFNIDKNIDVSVCVDA